MRHLFCFFWHRTRGRWLPNVDGCWYCLTCHRECVI
jgi:hypothetical protein